MHKKALAILSILTIFVAAIVSWAAVGIDSTELRNAVSAVNIVNHLVWLEGNGPRVSGTEGYDDAADYIADLMESAGYDVSRQEFTYDLWEELSDPVLNQVSPTPTTYPPYDVAGFATMEYSGAGVVTDR